MKQFLCVPLLLIFSGVAFSQSYIGTKKFIARQQLRSFKKDTSLSVTLGETDSTLTMSLGDDKWKPLQLTLLFDEKGRCIEEQRLSNCDSCFQTYITGSLEYGRIKWSKLNASQYIAAYPHKMMLEINDHRPFYYVIRRMDMSKKEYEDLINKLKN